MPDHYSNELPPDWPATSQTRWAVPLARVVMFLLSRYRPSGMENLPEPPYLVVSNHMSYFDVTAMAPISPVGIVGMAAKKYQGTWVEFFMRLHALIWVEQFSADREALKAALTVLKHGVPLAIAPEGTRSKVNALIEGRDGAAFIATRANVPIVPAAIWGTEKILKRPRPRARVQIGKPFRLPEGRAKGDQLGAYTERIMCAIAALMPEQYHGYYAGNPLIDEMKQLVC
ncbi:MAG: 1-acyl-sn-glycerol-3-phosphate acyltransferase [Anaerolineae bacterium]|nr:1-acyl-sn-glycerol-3-phosphate acyltransferase [Anaerolineae bacterium]